MNIFIISLVAIFIIASILFLTREVKNPENFIFSQEDKEWLKTNLAENKETITETPQASSTAPVVEPVVEVKTEPVAEVKVEPVVEAVKPTPTKKSAKKKKASNKK